MKIIESSIIGKKSPEACEDGMVVTDDFIAVIDGSTSKTPKHLNPDMKNGRYAMMLISEYIREELKAEEQEQWEQMPLEAHMEHYESQGMDHKSAMKQVAKDRGVSKRDIYRMLLELGQSD